MRTFYHKIKKLANEPEKDVWLFLALLLLLSTLWLNSYFYIYQARDFYRAREILSGSFITMGPEVNGGGRLLGPAYYYLLAALIKIFMKWELVWLSSVVMSAAGIVILRAFLQKYYSNLTANIWLSLSGSSIIIFWLLRQFINPTFLIFPVCLMLILLGYRSQVIVSKTIAIALGLLFGICLHFHLQVLPIGLGYLYLIYKNSQTSKLTAMSEAIIFFAFAFIAVSTVFFSPGTNSGTASGSARNIVSDFIQTFINEWKLDRELLRSLFLFLIVIFSPILFFLPRFSFSSYEKALLIISGLSFPSVFFYSLIEGRARYCLVFVLATALFYALRLRHLGSKKTSLAIFSYFFLSSITHVWWGGQEKIFFLLIPVLFLIFAVRENFKAFVWLGILLSVTAANIYFYNSPSLSFIPNFSQYYKIGKIVQSLSWSYKDSLERILYVNFFNQATPKIIWEGNLRLAIESPEKFENVDSIIGLIVINSRARPEALPRFMEYWSSKNKMEEKSGENYLPILGDPIFHDNELIVLPYYRNSLKSGVLIAQNLGSSYFTDQYAARLQKKIVLQKGEKKFSWNGCNGEQYCEIGFISKFSRRKSKWEITIAGEPISVPSINTLPDFTAAIVEPWVEWSCGDKNIRMILTSIVGYYLPPNVKKQRIHVLNGMLIAPLHFELEAPCVGSTPIRVGWKNIISTRSLKQQIENGAFGELK